MARLMTRLLVEFECGEHDEEVDRYFKYFNRETGKWMQRVHYDLLDMAEKISYQAQRRKADPNYTYPPLSEETKAKISAAKKGKLSTEVLAKMRAAHKGKKRTEETKAKISAANKGRKRSDEAKAKISAANKGRKRSDESIAKRIATRNRNLRNG